MVTENARMRQLRAPEADWITSDPVILDGEIAISSDIANRFKIGDGVSTWSQLSYVGVTPPPSDDAFYGFENGNPAAGVAYKDYSGDLNTIGSKNAVIYRLVSPITNAWPDFSPGNDYLLHMDYGDGKKVQIGYGTPSAGTAIPVVYTRYFNGTVWSSWNTNTVFQPVSFSGDLNTLAIGDSWQANVPLANGVVNAPSANIGAGSYLTHTQHNATLATQVVFDMSNPDIPLLWSRQWIQGVWRSWQAIGGSDQPMVWKGEWVGQTYRRGETVYDDGYLMVANKTTSDRAAPQPTGSGGYVYAGLAPETSDTASLILFGIRFSVPTDATARRVTKIRVFTRTGQRYNVQHVRNVGTGQEVFTPIVQFTGWQNGWTEVNVQPFFINSGTTFDLLAFTQVEDTSPTVTNLLYNYTIGQNPVVPTAGNVTHSRSQPGTLLVHKTDQNGDQSATLAAVAIGDALETAGQRWIVQSVSDEGTHFSFGISPALIGTTEGVQNFRIENQASQTVFYMEDTDYYGPTNDPDDIIKGLFAFNGGYFDAVVSDNAYGIDAFFEEVVVSLDWDFAAYTPNSDFAGGGGGGDGSSRITIGDTLPTAPVAGDLHFMTVEDVGLYVYYNDGASFQWIQTNGGGGASGLQEFHDPTGVASWRIVGNTLECWGTDDSGVSGNRIITFPKTFARPPSVTFGGINAAASDAGRIITVRGTVQAGQVTVDQRNTSNNVGNEPILWHAIGEWDGVS